MERPSLFFTIKVPAGQEANIMRFLKARAESSGVQVMSLIFVPKMRGYIFAEAERSYDVSKLVRGVSRAKLLPADPVTFQEIENLLMKEPEKVSINVGDVVRIIKGNFKGYQAKVTAITESEKGTVLVLNLVGFGKSWEIKMPVEYVKVVESHSEES